MVFTLNHFAVLIRPLPRQTTKNDEQISMFFFTAIVVIARATLALGGEIQSGKREHHRLHRRQQPSRLRMARPGRHRVVKVRLRGSTWQRDGGGDANNLLIVLGYSLVALHSAGAVGALQRSQ